MAAGKTAGTVGWCTNMWLLHVAWASHSMAAGFWEGAAQEGGSASCKSSLRLTLEVARAMSTASCWLSRHSASWDSRTGEISLDGECDEELATTVNPPRQWGSVSKSTWLKRRLSDVEWNSAEPSQHTRISDTQYSSFLLNQLQWRKQSYYIIQ